MTRLDTVATNVPFLAPLRPDEVLRALGRFTIVDLAPGESRPFAETLPECALVLSGHVRVQAVPIEGCPPLEETLDRGDHVGVHALLAGRATKGRIEAVTASRIACLDAKGYEALEAEFPVIAIPACAALAEELAWKDELLREIASIRTEDLSHEEKTVALDARRRRVAHRLARRGSRIAAYAEVVGDVVRRWLREPAFWMLGGFVAAFGGARTVVHEIFSHHAEEKYFNLHRVRGYDNPIHIHHFNYGLVLVTVASLLAFFPNFRHHLRILAFFFGLGAGLVFDEFGLIWNLDPNYYQGISWIAVGVVALLLAQLAFLRDAWSRRLHRFTHREVT